MNMVKRTFRRGLAAIFMMFLLLLLTGSSWAQSQSSQIEELKKQIEEIQRQNQQQIEELQRKIEQLESTRTADQEQLEKIKAEQEKDAEAWYRKFKAGYDKGFFLKSDDGNFSMRFRLGTQVQFSVNDTTDKDVATNFNIRRLRLIWNGNAFRPWFNYYLQLSGDNNGNIQLLDAFFDAAYNTQIFPRAGQWKVPFNRERLTSGSELQLVERSIVNAEFDYDRDRGAAIYGLLGNYVTYGGGVFNGTSNNGTSVDSNLLYAGRIMFTPCCGKLQYGTSSFPIKGDYRIEPNFGKRYPLIAFGAAAATIPGLNIDRKSADGNIDSRFEELGITTGDVTSITADVNFKYTIFSVEGEYDGRWIQPDQSGIGTAYDQGFRIQGGIFLLPHYIELAGRWAYIDFDNVASLNPDEDPLTKEWQVTPGINFYLSGDNRWKIQLDYSYIKDEFRVGQDINENIWRVQLQTYF
jgi:regulator of replication initiation timing